MQCFVFSWIFMQNDVYLWLKYLNPDIMPNKRIWKSKAHIMELWAQYIEKNKLDGFEKQVINPKTGNIDILTVPMPLTIEGFCAVSGTHARAFHRWLAWEGEEICPMDDEPMTENDKEIIDTLMYVRNEIQRHQYGGSINQMYNGAFVARYNGMAEKQEVNYSGGGSIKIEIAGDDLKLK